MAHRVSIPAFDPDLDAFIVHVDEEDSDYTFVADIAAMQALARVEAEFNVEETDNPTGEEALRQLDAGIEVMVICGKKRHPDLSADQIKGWFPSIRGLQAVVIGFQDYMEEIQGGAVPGEAATAKRRAKPRAKSNGRK